MRGRRFAAAAVAVMATLALAVAASPTGAAAAHRAPGSRVMWVQLGLTGVAQYYEPALARTPDGVLHLVYTSARADGYALVHVAIGPTGTVQQTNTILSGWQYIAWYPALYSAASGVLVLVFGGGSGQVGTWHDPGINIAYGNEAGTSWDLLAGRFGPDAYGIGSDRVAATGNANGTPVEAHTGYTIGGDTPGGYLSYHKGVNTNPADVYHDLGDPDGGRLMFDGSAVYAAWRNVAEGHLGVWVKQLEPSVAAPVRAPRSLTPDGVTGSDQPVATAVSSSGDVWLLYCKGKNFGCPRLLLWKVGTSVTYPVPQSANALDTALSAGPGGRLWLAWREGGDGGQTYAVRTGRDGHTFGTVRHIADTGLDLGVRKLAIEGSRGPLDMFLNTVNKPWHRQIDPALSLYASPSHWSAATRTSVRFGVADAGAPVRDATVRQGTRSCVTNRTGSCRLVFAPGPPRSYRVVAVKGGYYRGVVTVHAR